MELVERGGDDTRLVLAARAGDAQAFRLLVERWIDRVYDVAFHVVGDRGTAGEVSHEVFLAARQALGSPELSAGFGAWVLGTSRDRAVRRLPPWQPAVPVGNEELVRAVSAALGVRDTSLLHLHLRHGVSAADIGHALGMSETNTQRLLDRLRDKLAYPIGAVDLYRAGSPTCADLAAVLAASGVDHFGADAIAVIGRHVATCTLCAERQQSLRSFEAQFASVPVAAAGSRLEAQVVAALDALPAAPPAEPEPPATTAAVVVGDGPPDPLADADDAITRSRRRAGLVVLTAAVVLVLAVLALGLVLADPAEDDAGSLDAGGRRATTTTTARRATSTSGAGSPVADGDTTSTSAAGATTTTTTVAAEAETTTTGRATSTTSPSDTTAPTEPPPPPVIHSFTYEPRTEAGPCVRTDDTLYLLRWTSTGGSEAFVSGPTDPTVAPLGGKPPNTGEVPVPACVTDGALPEFYLTVYGSVDLVSAVAVPAA